MDAPIIFKILHTPRFTHAQLKSLLEVPPELKEHPDIVEIFKGKDPIICYTKAPNLKSIIDKAQQSAHNFMR